VSAPSANAIPPVKTDSELIARAQDGDPQACAAIFDLHRRRVYSPCLLMTKNVSDAEDLTQDAFIQIFRGLNSFRGDSALFDWQFEIATAQSPAEDAKVVGVRQEKNWEKAYTGRLGTKAGGWATRDSCLLRLPAGTSC